MQNEQSAMETNDYDADTDVDEEMQNEQSKMEINDYDADTDVEEEMEAQGSKLKLPNLFTGMNFFLHGNIEDALHFQLCRYMVAFDGKIEKVNSSKVTHIVTSTDWNDNFDEIKRENSKVRFVEPAWIFKCAKMKRLQSCNGYEVQKVRK